MSNTAYTSFLPKVSPEVPGCPLSVAEDAVREAAIEFCEKSWAWIYTHDAISSIANEGVYPFEPPTGALVSRVLQAWYESRELIPRTADQLSEEYQNWTTATGSPKYMVQDNEDELIIVPKPTTNVSNAITLRVCLKPTHASTAIETRLYEHYLNTIAMGAKAKLMMMSDKPWANLKMAATYQSLFEENTDAARYKAQKGYGRAVRRVVGSYF